MVALPAVLPRVVDRWVDRIGLAVGSESVRAVGLRASRIVWALESPLTGDEPLVAALERFLRELPLHRLHRLGSVARWPRPAVRAVLGARRAQVKRLTGLPPGLDVRQLAQLVEEGAPRFFLRNGHPLVTTGVVVAPDGARWSAALDASVVDALRAACHGAGLRLALVGPTAAALPLALEGSTTEESTTEDGGGEVFRWVDDGEGVVLRVSAGRLSRIARFTWPGMDEPEHPSAATLSRPRPLLAPLAERAPRFAAAYGAALLPAHAPLLHRPQRAAPVSSRSPRWRTALAIVALLLAAAAAVLARPLAAVRAERAATARLAALGVARAEAARVQNDLEQVSAALAEVDRFAVTRRSPTLLLAGLARALPQGSALLAVRMEARTDTSGVIATFLAPRAAPVLGAIEQLPIAVSPQIVGPVTREVVGGGVGGEAGGRAGTASERTTRARMTRERMTVRFRLVSPARASSDADTAPP